MLSFFCRKFLYSTHQHDAGRYIHRLFTLPRNAKALSSQKGVSCSHSRHRLSSCYGWILPHLFPFLPFSLERAFVARSSNIPSISTLPLPLTPLSHTTQPYGWGNLKPGWLVTPKYPQRRQLLATTTIFWTIEVNSSAPQALFNNSIIAN